MTDKQKGERQKSEASEWKYECGADCPTCAGGTCFLETGHSGLHQCASCGNTWETLHHLVSHPDL